MRRLKSVRRRWTRNDECLKSLFDRKSGCEEEIGDPIALVCAFFGVAVAYSTVELFLRGETGSGVMCLPVCRGHDAVYRIFRHAYRKLSARRIAEALIPLSEESLTFDQLQTVLSSEKAIQQIKTLIGKGYLQNLQIDLEERTVGAVRPGGRLRAVGLSELRRKESRSKGRRAALQILRPAARTMTEDSTIRQHRLIRRRVWR